jgi:hypothetical protein
MWYTVSCANIFLSFLKKVKSLVHNFVWSSKANSKAKTKAKVTWDITILPLIKVGIKILDIEAQTFALLTKMLIQGFNLRPEPWKIFIHHKVDQLR